MAITDPVNLKTVRSKPGPQEIELKLALPTANPSTLARRLARTPLLARRKCTQLHLHAIYFDTPEMLLRQQGVALRLRRTGEQADSKWLQTLKTADRGNSALSRRGEWEKPADDASLSLAALEDTPWSTIDTDGSLFLALEPAFETAFERTLWLVRRRDGSVVEVALDIGQIVLGSRSAPICELELELKAGRVTALFDIALQFADSIALIPAGMSKAEQGYALARDSIGAAVHAQPQPLPAKLPLPETAQRVLREMFSQFTTNLNTLLISDDPEVVHQARVGWRRFKSAKRFLRPVLPGEAVPSWLELLTLLTCLRKLRDLDVARTETLPPIAPAYTAQDPRRVGVWQSMTLALNEAANLQRKAARYALQVPAVGACLLAITKWLEGLTDPGAAEPLAPEPTTPPRRWALARIRHLHKQLKLASSVSDQPDQQHRVRILAKRVRYNTEALKGLLPSKLARRWQQQASGLQDSLGAARDARQAAVLVTELKVDPELAEFLRGFAAGAGTPPTTPPRRIDPMV